MRNLARTSLMLGALLSASGALALVAVGCGGDDTSVGSTDGSADGTSMDASPDHHVGKDGEAADAKKHKDGESEAESDDGGESEASDDGPAVDAPTLADFPNTVNTAWCQRLADCCDGNDAGAFQLSECISGFGTAGWLNVSLANTQSGHIAYDPANAAKCLGDIGAMSCGTLSSTAIEQQISTCGQAMVGKLDVGAKGCTSAWDCAPPAYCDNFEADGGVVDGGTGTCKALAAAGSPCQDLLSSTDCSEIGNGHPDNFCSPGDGGGAVCTPEFANGVACNFAFYQCQSQICDNTTGLCQSTTIFSDPGDASIVCAFYNTPVDAGP
jgi:hypothetical protein